MISMEETKENDIEEQINTLVRDATSVEHFTKSEIRRRIMAIADHYYNDGFESCRERKIQMILTEIDCAYKTSHWRKVVPHIYQILISKD